jgi:hypothetical protein
VRSRWRCGRARRGIDKGDGVVCFRRIFDVCAGRCEGLRVVVVRAIVLLVLALGLLLFVELSLILLIL